MQITPRLPGEKGRQYALRTIKENIIHLEIPPGTLLSASDLAEKLQLSRTPVSEALLELNTTGIVEVLPQIGSRVSYIDYDLVDESRFTRLTLEREIIQIVCQTVTAHQLGQLSECLALQQLYVQRQDKYMLLQLDNRFHEMLFHFANKDRTYAAIQNLEIHFDRVRSLSFMAGQGERTLQEHQELYEAISAHDAPQACRLIECHLTNYQMDKESILSLYPQYMKHSTIER